MTLTPARPGVPAHSRMTIRERASSRAVVVFALNEGSRLVDQVTSMAAGSDHADIILADGGSSDGSIETIVASGLRAVRTVLVNRGERGLGVQMRMAFDYAIAQGYEGVVVVDGNGKDDVSAIPAFLAELDRGVDHVQGSRFVPGGHAINTPLDRLLGLRLLHAPLIRLASGFAYTDTTNGFRAYSSRFLSDSRVDMFRDAFVGYELHYYLAIRAARLGFAVSEIPVTRRYPKGAVPTKIHGFRGKVRLLGTLIAVVSGRFDPKPVS